MGQHSFAKELVKLARPVHADDVSTLIEGHDQVQWQLVCTTMQDAKSLLPLATVGRAQMQGVFGSSVGNGGLAAYFKNHAVYHRPHVYAVMLQPLSEALQRAFLKLKAKTCKRYLIAHLLGKPLPLPCGDIRSEPLVERPLKDHCQALAWVSTGGRDHQCIAVNRSEPLRVSDNINDNNYNYNRTDGSQDAGVSAFPTETAIRKREERLAAKEAGTTIEVKKKKFVIEEHYDDCGEDLSSLGMTEVDQSVSSGPPPGDDLVDGMLGYYHDTIGDCLEQLMFHGRVAGVVDPPETALVASTPSHLDSLLSAAAQGTDIMEICGGDEESRIGRVSVRRRLRHGGNYDLTTNYDLNSPADQAAVERIIIKHRPLVLVMSPACTPFGPLGNFNKVVNYETWLESYRKAAPHGRFCARLALLQLSQRCHFIVEQPYPSALFEEGEWPKVLRNEKVVHRIFHQCRTGQRAACGRLAKKPTQLYASHEALVAPFEDLKCNGRHEHANTEARLSRPLQKYTWDMAARIVQGIVNLKSAITKAYPSTSTNTVDEAPEPPWKQCEGCRKGNSQYLKNHSRVRGICKYPDVEPIDYSCPGCQAGKPPKAGGPEGHNNIPGECHWGGVYKREYAPRRGKHPRPPARRGSTDPTAEMRAVDGEGELGAEDEAAAAAGSSSSSSSAAPVPAEEPVQEPPAADPEGGPPSTGRRGRGPDQNPRVRAPKIQRADAAVGEVTTDWTNFDIGRVLRGLRTAAAAGRRRILRKLHLRWWHASAAAMSKLLSRAGIPQHILDELHNVVDTCATCRTWAKPQNEAVPSVALPTAFNAQVEADLMFYKKYIILNLLDRTTRWHAARVIQDKQASTILDAVDEMWFSHHGAMQEFIMDGERAVAISGDAADAFKRRGVKLHIRAPGQHARLVERRQALLRDALHKIDEQLISDGLQRIPMKQRLSEAVFAGNALLTINGATPYCSVYGRVPHLLPELNADIPDGVGRDVASRDVNRLREISIQSMVEGTAQARVQRAMKAKTQPAAQENFEIGLEVDFWRQPPQKDLPGWSGPGKITDMSEVTRGIIKVEFKNKEYLVSPGDLRRSLTFFALLIAPHLTNLHDRAIQTIRRWLATTKPGRIYTFGMVRTSESTREKTPNHEWMCSRDSTLYPVMHSALANLAEVTLGLTEVAAYRVGTGMSSIPGVSDYATTSMMTWHKNEPSDYTFHDIPMPQSVSLRDTFGEQWQDIRWIQFHTLSDDGFPAIEEVDTPAGEATPRPQPSADRFQPTLDTIPEGSRETSVPSEPELEALFASLALEDVVEREPDEPVRVTHGDHAQVAVVPDALYHVRSAVYAADRPVDAARIIKEYEPEPEEVLLAAPPAHKKQVIERDTDLLTPAELETHAEAVKAAMISELKTWAKLKCISRRPRAGARNIVDSRWVYKWKWEKQADGNDIRIIRARLTCRGFKDHDASTLETYAGTAQRCSQRLLCSTAVNHGWRIMACDVPKAFLQGVTYEELAERTGEPMREVNLELTRAAAELLKHVPGFEDFNWQTEVLHNDKPGTGLVDAPRAFSMKVGQVLEQCGLRPISVDEEVWVLTEQQGNSHKDSEAGALRLLLTKHVDDLKMTGPKERIQKVLDALEKVFGKLVEHWDQFTNCGMRHISDLTKGTITVDQDEYIAALKPIVHPELGRSCGENAVGGELLTLYQSLLGAVADAVPVPTSTLVSS